MVYPEHYLMQFGGTFASDPGEIWSNNIRFAHREDLDGATLREFSGEEQDSIATDLLTKQAVFMQTADSGYSSNVKLQWLKFNRINPAGLYADAGSTHVAFTNPASGTPGAGTGTGVVTTSLVVTWLTDRERGRASRGRVFVPHPSVTLGATDYRITLAKRQAIAAAWRAHLLNLQDWPGVPTPNDPVASVLSERSTPAVWRPINQVQVGDLLDYMGSRRNNLTEARTASAVL